MRKLIIPALVAAVLLAAIVGVGEYAAPQDGSRESVTVPGTDSTNAVPQPKAQACRGVWVSYMEVPKAGESGEDYAAAAEKLFAGIAQAGFNTAFVHVRAFADSAYPSKLFPRAQWLSGGKALSYDPLELLLAAAKKHGIAFHAWINPFRVQTTADESKLPAESPAAKWLKDGSGLAINAAGGIYLNPAAPQVHRLIYDGVEEILRGYDVDGIHIDDYFYPSSAAEIDAALYEEYQKQGGRLSLGDWRRAAISGFVAGLYRSIKAINKEVLLSISPGGNIRRNRESLYADVELWASRPGYMDMLIPQLYYGFENSAIPFESAAREWDRLATAPGLELVFGLAAYKAGKEDPYAGDGRGEWQQHGDILARQAAFALKLRSRAGIALFSYDYVLGEKSPAAKVELACLQKSGAWG